MSWVTGWRDDSPEAVLRRIRRLGPCWSVARLVRILEGVITEAGPAQVTVRDGGELR
jgi:hypothetical protein